MHDDSYTNNLDELEAIYEQEAAATTFYEEEMPPKRKPKRERLDELATSAARVGGFVIDYVIFAVVTGVITALLPAMSFLIPGFTMDSEAAQVIPMLLYFGFGVAFQVIIPVQLGGSTLGKYVTGTRIVMADGAPVGYGRMFLRNIIGYWASSVFFYLGYLWVFFNDDRRGWHDHIANTVVVKR